MGGYRERLKGKAKGVPRLRARRRRLCFGGGYGMLGTVTRDSGKGGRHAEAKWDMNAIYISERLQESLRPIARCPLTTVVAPMGYGKTTAVNWYPEERARTETPRIIRISVYSDNLAIFWKSVQDALTISTC